MCGTIIKNKENVVAKILNKNKKTNLKKGFGPESLVCIYSCGKSIASILMAIMHDKGNLFYDTPIVDYWPEFGKK